MLGKGSQPTIGKLAGALRAGIMDSTTSRRSPLGFIMQSPRGPKTYDLGGIGLGIVAALDKSNNGSGQGEVLARYAICGQFSARLGPTRGDSRAEGDENNGGKFRGQVMIEMKVDGLDEGSSHVTCHGTSKSMATKVYHDASEFDKTSENVVVSKISPVRSAGDRCFPASDSQSDFLSSCHLCKKALHGKDIYMYGGEKAFCSAECRQRQIWIDERKEKYRSEEIVRSSEITNSPCSYTTNNTRGEIYFSTGVVTV